jgi:signal transduction histidine kinase
MERLTRDLLTLARSDRHALTLAEGRVDLGALAGELVSRVRLVAETRGVELDLHVQGASPVVDGDPDRLEQVGLILVDNALKHTPRGGQVHVVVRREGTRALIEIADTGEGIPREHLMQVFDRFYRVDRTRSRATGGAGLGLSIAQTLVVAHGGGIAVKNQPGGGTLASVWLPLSSNESTLQDPTPMAVRNESISAPGSSVKSR